MFTKWDIFERFFSTWEKPIHFIWKAIAYFQIFNMKLQLNFKPRSFKLNIIDIWARCYFVGVEEGGRLGLCIVGCLATSRTSTHWIPGAPPYVVTTKNGSRHDQIFWTKTLREGNTNWVPVPCFRLGKLFPCKIIELSHLMWFERCWEWYQP